MSVEKDAASLAMLRADAEALLSVIQDARDRIYSRKERGEQGLEADFRFANSMSEGIKETMEKVGGFARSHIYSKDGVIMTRGSHAHDKLKDLLDKIPRRLLKARVAARRLERYNQIGP